MDDIYNNSLDGSITKEDALNIIKSNPFELFEVADKLRQEIVGEDIYFCI